MSSPTSLSAGPRDAHIWLAIVLAGIPLSTSLVGLSAHWIAISSQLALVTLALSRLAGLPPKFEPACNQHAWRDLTLGLRVLWLESAWLLTPTSLVDETWIARAHEPLHTIFYLFLISAVERRATALPSGQLSEPAPSRMLRILFMVSGLFAYFIVLPRLTDPSVSSAPVLFVVASTFPIARISWILSRPARSQSVRGSPIHPLLGTALACLAVGELIGFWPTAVGSWTASASFVQLALVLLVVLARHRHRFQVFLEQNPSGLPAVPSIGPGQITLLCAFVLPLIHLGSEVGSAAGLVPPPCCKVSREIFLAIWLVLAGGLAIAQHRRFHRQLLTIGYQRIQAKNALRKSQASLALMVERQNNRRAVHEANLNFATIFRASPRGLSICSFPGLQILEANTRFADLCQQPLADLQGKTLEDIGLCPRRSDLQQLAQEHRLHGVECTLRLPSGDDLPVKAMFELLDLKLGSTVLVVAQSARSDAALDTCGNHTAIFDNPSAAVIGCTADGLVYYWSQGAERLFERPAVETLGLPVETFLGENAHHLLLRRVDPLSDGDHLGGFVIFAIESGENRRSPS